MNTIIKTTNPNSIDELISIASKNQGLLISSSQERCRDIHLRCEETGHTFVNICTFEDFMNNKNYFLEKYPSFVLDDADKFLFLFFQRKLKGLSITTENKECEIQITQDYISSEINRLTEENQLLENKKSEYESYEKLLTSLIIDLDKSDIELSNTEKLKREKFILENNCYISLIKKEIMSNNKIIDIYQSLLKK